MNSIRTIQEEEFTDREIELYLNNILKEYGKECKYSDNISKLTFIKNIVEIDVNHARGKYITKKFLSCIYGNGKDKISWSRIGKRSDSSMKDLRNNILRRINQRISKLQSTPSPSRRIEIKDKLVSIEDKYYFPIRIFLNGDLIKHHFLGPLKKPEQSNHFLNLEDIIKDGDMNTFISRYEGLLRACKIREEDINMLRSYVDMNIVRTDMLIDID